MDYTNNYKYLEGLINTNIQIYNSCVYEQFQYADKADFVNTIKYIKYNIYILHFFWAIRMSIAYRLVIIQCS